MKSVAQVGAMPGRTEGAAGDGRLLEWLMLAGAALAPFNLVLGVQISGLNLRPLHIWALAVTLALLAADRDQLVRRADAGVLAFWWLLAFVILSTAFATPVEYRQRGLADAALLGANVVAFTAVRCYYAGRPDAWARFLKLLAISAVCVSALFLWRAISAVLSGVPVQQDSYALGLGTVVGTYTSAFAAGAAAFIVFARTGRALVAGLGAFAVYATAAVLALARGPWLAFLIGLMTAVGVVAWRSRAHQAAAPLVARAGAMLLAGPLAAGVILILSPFARDLVRQRVFQLLDFEAGTAWGRFVLWDALLRDARFSPLFGHGASAYRAVAEALGAQGSVAENFLIEMLHSAGAVGVLLLVVGIAAAAFHLLDRAVARDRPELTAACIAAVIAVVIGAMTNPAAWNGLFWIILGVAAAHPRAPAVPVRRVLRTPAPSAQPLLTT